MSEAPILTFHCLQCGRKYYLHEKEAHAKTHGYKEVPKSPVKKKRKKQLVFPEVEKIRKRQTD